MNKGIYLSLDTAFAHSKGLNEEAAKLGVTLETCTEAKSFLLSMHVETPKVVFIAFILSQEKTIAALIKSVRKVLGPALPIYLVTESALMTQTNNLLPLGITALIEAPVKAATLSMLLAPIFPDVAAKAAAAAPAKKAPPKAPPKAPAADANVPVQKPAPASTAPGAPASALAPKPVPGAAAPGKAPVKIKLPEIINWIFDELFPLLAKVSLTYDNLDDAEARARLYAKKLQPISEEFVDHIKSLKRSSGESEVLELIQYARFYGLDNCKFLITASKVLEVTRGEPLKWDPKSKRPVETPKKVLQTAARFLDAFGEDGIFKEVAFNCGVLFDFLWILANKDPERKASLLQMYDKMVIDIIQQTKLVIGKAKGMQDSLAAKHILTIFVLTEAGKFAMAVFLPAYVEFNKLILSKECKPALCHIAEKGYFGTSHNVVGALFALITPGVSKAYSAILCARYPYILSTGNEEAKELQALVVLANNTTK